MHSAVNNMDLYDVLDIIGSGGYGQVMRVRHKSTNAEYAIKKCNLAGILKFYLSYINLYTNNVILIQI